VNIHLTMASACWTTVHSAYGHRTAGKNIEVIAWLFYNASFSTAMHTTVRMAVQTVVEKGQLCARSSLSSYLVVGRICFTYLVYLFRCQKYIHRQGQCQLLEV